MSRIARFVRNDQPTVYHVISRTALPGLPIKAWDKDYLLHLIRRLSALYVVDVLGFALMDNHFHLVARVYPESDVSDRELIQRYKEYYGQDQIIAGEMLDHYRKRLTSLGSFVKDIKQGFTRYYNKKYNRQGYFWGGRFTQLNRPEVYGGAVLNRVKVFDRAGRPDSGQFAGLCGFKPHPGRGGQASGGLSMVLSGLPRAEQK